MRRSYNEGLESRPAARGSVITRLTWSVSMGFLQPASECRAMRSERMWPSHSRLECCQRGGETQGPLQGARSRPRSPNCIAMDAHVS